MKARSFLSRRVLAEKLIKLRISRYTDEKLEVNQIPNRHSSNREIKCVDACTIDINIEKITLKQQNLQLIIKVMSKKIRFSIYFGSS